MADINGYSLSRAWFAFTSVNYGKVKPIHTALYFWTIEVWNSLNQPKEFGLPAKEAMHHIGIGRHEPFTLALKDLTDWGFLIIKQPSINQYKANIIALCPPLNARGNRNSTAQGNRNGTGVGTAPVIEPLNKELLNIESIGVNTPNTPAQDFSKKTEKTKKLFVPPANWQEVAYYMRDYLNEKEIKWQHEKIKLEAEKFFNYYLANGWKVGKNPMKDWKATARNWIANADNFNNGNNGGFNAGAVGPATPIAPKTPVSNEELARQAEEVLRNGS